MQEGTITAWNASVGQAIAKGDALLDVETEEIVNSVEAPVFGTLRWNLADVGGTETVGALIAVVADIGVEDAEIDSFIANFKPADTSFEPDAGGVAVATGPAAEPARASSAPPAPANLSVAAGDEGEQRVSPIAGRLAEKLGIDVSKIKGTGTHRHVSKEDVESYAASLAGGAPAAAAVDAAAVSGAAPTREKMTSMRATIARRLLESKQSIPYYRLSIDVDLTALLAHRARRDGSGSAKISINDLPVRVTALALVNHPVVNSQLNGDEIVRHSQADICVAVAT